MANQEIAAEPDVILLDTYLAGAIAGGHSEGVRRVRLDTRIWVLTLSAGDVKAWLNRWVWQQPQTLMGFLAAHMVLLFGKVKEVEGWQGCTVLHGGGWRGSVCFGDIIILHRSAGRHTLQHEYGHTLQSRATGPLYLPFYGLPSILDNRHSKAEGDANRRGFGEETSSERYWKLDAAHRPRFWHWLFWAGFWAAILYLIIN